MHILAGLVKKSNAKYEGVQASGCLCVISPLFFRNVSNCIHSVFSCNRLYVAISLKKIVFWQMRPEKP